MPPMAVAPRSPNRNSTRRYRHSQLRRRRGAVARVRGGAARRRERAGARRDGAGRGLVSVADGILAWGVRGEGLSVPTAGGASDVREDDNAESSAGQGARRACVVRPQAGGTDPPPSAGCDEQPRAERKSRSSPQGGARNRSLAQRGGG